MTNWTVKVQELPSSKRLVEVTALSKRVVESTRNTLNGIKERICLAAREGDETLTYYDYDCLDLNEISYIVFYLRYRGIKVDYKITIDPDDPFAHNYVEYDIDWKYHIDWRDLDED